TEYGIRGATVTGVQTCALPISLSRLLGPRTQLLTMPQPIGWSFSEESTPRRSSMTFGFSITQMAREPGHLHGVRSFRPERLQCHGTSSLAMKRMMEHRRGCLSLEGWGVLGPPLPSMTLGC